MHLHLSHSLDESETSYPWPRLGNAFHSSGCRVYQPAIFIPFLVRCILKASTLSLRPPLLVHPFVLYPLVRPHFPSPPGCAHAEILVGQTKQLRIVTPGRLTWAPCQHFFVCIPYLSKFASHPFTCASVCDEQRLGNDGRSRMVMFLILAKNGWTKDLRTKVVELTGNDTQKGKFRRVRSYQRLACF